MRLYTFIVITEFQHITSVSYFFLLITKTSISFWCSQELSLRFLIQLSEILLVELTRTHIRLYTLISHLSSQSGSPLDIKFVFLVFRAFPTESSNFCTVWRMNSDFYLYLPIFSNTLYNRLSISFSISFKYYFFIHYLFIFLITTHLPVFFYSTPDYCNSKKGFEE